MPKEVIRSRPELDDGAGAYIPIGWGRDAEYVQVGVVAPEGEYKLLARAPEGEWIEVEPTDGVGLYVQLDRAGINAAIRTLRKARDQAFGRDE